MKRFLQKAVCLILLFLLALPAKAYASNGSGNMDGGGSGMGQGTSTNYWTPGYDGVRITVVDASSGSAVSSPVDFSNKTFNKPLVHLPKRINFSIWPVLPLNLPVVLMYIRFQLLPCPIL